ncbi:DUF1007 family protein [soil metagenome]
MPTDRLRAALIALALPAALSCLAPTKAQAHPHVFIDSGVDFLFDAEGRLSHLRVIWIYDALASLFMLEDLAIEEGPDGRIGEADKAALAAYQSQWIDGFEGDGTLHHERRRIGLSRPIEPQADYRGGQVEIRFLRALDEPITPGPGTVAKLYDPTYFSAYFVTMQPALEHAPAPCRAEVVPFEPTGPLLALQQTVAAVPIDEDPEEDVGHLFADRIYVTCE